MLMTLKADVRGQKFMSKKIIKFETFDHLKVKCVSIFSHFVSLNLKSPRQKKIIADLRTVLINTQFKCTYCHHGQSSISGCSEFSQLIP